MIPIRLEFAARQGFSRLAHLAVTPFAALGSGGSEDSISGHSTIKSHLETKRQIDGQEQRALNERRAMIEQAQAGAAGAPNPEPT